MLTALIPCPDCRAACARQGREFDGGYLLPSRDYTSLQHCNLCGAYWARVDYRTPLHRVTRSELWKREEVSR